MREVLDRLKAQLLARLPGYAPDYSGSVVPREKTDLSELGAVASAVRDYMEAELLYRQTVLNGTTEETA